MASDPNNPTTLEKLAALTGQVAVFIPVAGQMVQIASVGLQALAGFLDASGADKTELDKTHAEYQRRLAIARDPNS